MKALHECYVSWVFELIQNSNIFWDMLSVSSSQLWSLFRISKGHDLTEMLLSIQTSFFSNSSSNNSCFTFIFYRQRKLFTAASSNIATYAWEHVLTVTADACVDTWSCLQLQQIWVSVSRLNDISLSCVQSWADPHLSCPTVTITSHTQWYLNRTTLEGENKKIKKIIQHKIFSPANERGFWLYNKRKHF